MASIIDDISDSYCTVETVYDHNLHSDETFLFDFKVDYTIVPEPGSDGEADYLSSGVETRTRYRLKEYGRDWFVGRQGEEQIQDTVLAILCDIGVPPYRGIVTTFTEEMENIMMEAPLENLWKIKVMFDVSVPEVPEDDEKYSVGGASAEAIEEHLEILTVTQNAGDCAICLETIQVGSDLVGRMPCKHLFHRACIEMWLEESAICPLCRDLFPV